MVTRREDFKGSRDKIPKLIEEAGMRHFIAVGEIPVVYANRNCLPSWMSRLSNSMYPIALKNIPLIIQKQATIPQLGR